MYIGYGSEFKIRRIKGITKDLFSYLYSISNIVIKIV